ncbi:olfactory receptor 7E178-like [Thomomys bottae]
MYILVKGGATAGAPCEETFPPVCGLHVLEKLTTDELIGPMGGHGEFPAAVQCGVGDFDEMPEDRLMTGSPTIMEPDFQNSKLQKLIQSLQISINSLTYDPEIQPVLFGIFLFMYQTTVLGNLLIILAVSSDHHFHTPHHEDRKDGMDITSGEDAHVNRCTQGDWKVYVLGEFAGLMMVGEPVISLSSGISSNLQHQMTLQLKSSMYTYTESNLSPINAELCNLTHISEFYLLGLSDDLELQLLLFGLFLSIYLITVLGNLLIILAVTSDPHLHTPMYFFLSNLSLANIGFTSTTVPKMLVDIQTHGRTISYAGCLTQKSISLIFGCTDLLLLSVMAYDRFVAICHPLNYPLTMNPCLCVSLVLLSFVNSFLVGLMRVWMALKMTNFKEVEIPSLFCDPSQVLDLSCKHTLTDDLFKYIFGTIFCFFPIFGILFSCYKIISSMLRISSSSGKYKDFSTCGSQLSVVCLFFGIALGVYFASAVSHSPRVIAVSSAMYTVVTPLLNPFIYSLRNRGLQSALNRLMKPGAVLQKKQT